MDAFESRLASVARKGIEGLIESRSRAVLGGSARTFDQHQRDIGYLMGLSAGLEELEAARKGVLNEERA
jgi:hypothetical protein